MALYASISSVLRAYWYREYFKECRMCWQVCHGNVYVTFVPISEFAGSLDRPKSDFFWQAQFRSLCSTQHPCLLPHPALSPQQQQQQISQRQRFLIFLFRITRRDVNPSISRRLSRQFRLFEVVSKCTTFLVILAWTQDLDNPRPLRCLISHLSPRITLFSASLSNDRFWLEIPIHTSPISNQTLTAGYPYSFVKYSTERTFVPGARKF